jgi:hypothetical protein
VPFAPPLDFRYVALTPAPPSRRWVWAALSGTSGLALALLSWGGDLPGTVFAALAGGVGAFASAYVLGRRAEPASAVAGSSGFLIDRADALGGTARPAAMAIVPWGVLLSPDTDDERVLRWAAVRDVGVAWIHERGVDGVPSTRESVVTISTATERLEGRAPGHVSLERLQARFADYRAEASRPLALDWSGELTFENDGFGGVSSLLEAAQALLRNPSGREALVLDAMSYREEAPPRPSAMTAAIVGEVLGGSEIAGSVDTLAPAGGALDADAAHASPEPLSADRRALAALLAGELGLSSLLPTLRRLVLSVHPVLAACAKAAALRLGAEPTQVGALSEVAPFLSDDDLALLSEWVSTKPRLSV